MSEPAPVSAAEFAASMAALRPFETRPRVAVAVSGGPDSLALALLTDAWTRVRAGSAVGLVVDHGLRPGSAVEARRVGRWLAQRNVRHERLTLAWPGGAPTANVQAQAREARYAALLAWCATHGVVHLAVGHQLEDQAETFLLRLRRGGGVSGLAAMAPVVDRPEARILRPLLGFPKARLAATLQRAGQAWIDDPSNADRRYDRVRLRALLPDLARCGFDPPRLTAVAADAAVLRAGLDRAANAVLGRLVSCHPAGFLRIDHDGLRGLPDGLAMTVLARSLATVSGRRYPPRARALSLLHAALRDDAGFRDRTLAGCRLLVGYDRRPGRRRGVVYVCRELAACAPPMALVAGPQAWDERFAVRGPAAMPRRAAVARLGAVGQLLPQHLRRRLRDRLDAALPAAVIAALPMIERGGVHYVPDVVLRRGDDQRDGLDAALRPWSDLAGSDFPVEATFRPRYPLTMCPFAAGSRVRR